MQNIAWICFWPFILIVILLRNELGVLRKWKNVLAMIIIGFLTILFFRSHAFYLTAISYCADSYGPFYDQLSTSLALVTREEIVKGIMIAVLLVFLKFLNPQISMQWAVVIAPFYICSLFSWNEAMGYYQNSMNTTFLGRALFPVHLIFQMPMVFILFKYYKKGGRMRQVLIFCGSICAAIGIHFLWNACVTLDNDLYKYMAANIYYWRLFYACTFIKIVSAALLLLFVICLWFSVFCHFQHRNSVFSSWKVGDSLLKTLRNKAYLFPIMSILFVGLFIVSGLYQYRFQKIKPLQMIGDYREVKNNNVKVYINERYDSEEIDLATLPLVQTINKGEITIQKPYNYNLVPKYSYKPNELYKISIYGYKQYLLYKDIVIGFFPDNNNKKTLSIIQ